MWRRKTGKLLVVGSSLLLGCGYVGYRHREQAQAPADGKAVLPGSKNPAFSGSKDPVRVTVLPSSKNIDAILNSPNRVNSPAPGDDPPP